MTIFPATRAPERPLRVLLADDLMVNQIMGDRILRGLGFDVTLVSDGRPAVEAVEAGEFDLVLMDLVMPLMDGFEAVAAIRAAERENGGHVLIFALTAEGSQTSRSRCLEAGFDGYLTKPIRAEALEREFEALGRPGRLLLGREEESAKTVEFDRVAALAYVGGDPYLLDRVLALFLGDCQRLSRAIHSAIVEEDGPTLRRLAHTLAGAASNIAAPEVTAEARRLEAMGNSNDLAGAYEVFDELDRAIERVRAIVGHTVVETVGRADGRNSFLVHSGAEAARNGSNDCHGEPRGGTRHAPSASGLGLPEPPPDGARVLIVDDSLVDRFLAGEIVTKTPGLFPTFAENGVEALESIAREEPIAILTDLQMPEMDGLSLVRECRKRHPHIPVILMTAFGSEEIVMRSLRAGAASYVAKKSLVNELIPTLTQVLSMAAAGLRRQRLLGALRHRVSSFNLESDPELIGPLIELLQEDLAAMGLGDPTERLHVGVALQEALTNALYHGNLEVSSDLRQEDERLFFEEAERRRLREPYRSRRIYVDVHSDSEAATYVIRDEGPGFDLAIMDRPVDAEDVLRIGGRGLLLIRTFMDEVSHNTEGNEITMIKRRSG